MSYTAEDSAGRGERKRGRERWGEEWTKGGREEGRGGEGREERREGELSE